MIYAGPLGRQSHKLVEYFEVSSTFFLHALITPQLQPNIARIVNSDNSCCSQEIFSHTNFQKFLPELLSKMFVLNLIIVHCTTTKNSLLQKINV